MEPEELEEFTEPVALFKGWVRSMVSDRKGQLVLTVAVPLEEKYAAMPVTDNPGLMLGIVCARRPRSTETSDAEPDSEGLHVVR